ncbi:MAG: 30S ribosomal protein S2 [Nitrososphaerales archaeon]|nr:30S ribosomal protein S2 [Nitrososphaerales archaeon]
MPEEDREDRMSEEEEKSTEKLSTTEISEKALLATGIRVGTLVKTKFMAPFISRTRSDGLHIIDIGKTLSRIEIAGKFISSYDLSKVVVYSAREYGKTPVEKFCELTGAIPITGRFMPGTFTNPLYPGHIDAELLIVTDPAIDYQAVDEATKIGIPVIAICDTDNVTSNVDLVIPANNRGRKALAAVFWLLARSVLTRSGALQPGQPMKYTIEDFETKLVEEEAE